MCVLQQGEIFSQSGVGLRIKKFVEVRGQTSMGMEATDARGNCDDKCLTDFVM